MEKVEVKIVGIFAYLFFTYLVGSLIFTKGFLLKRDVVDSNSSCRADFANYWDGEKHGAEGCWLHRRFDKAILLVIDALRFDFMAPVDTQENNSNLPYINKLQELNKLMRDKPQNGRLFRFVADPPTTTLQRLKGLTTGSLPTFVDAGSNFASTEILEDNFIDQLIKRGKKITFMGDDTWMSLFPKKFQRAYPFPSFNVKDLHTVDSGVLSHIYRELKRPDWDLMIAHFLGVDHCGHRYGPNHPAMSEKLTQMDNMIRNVTRQMDSRTILFVLGDHGMTASGDHGGDSADELNAGLFVYSPAQITASKPQQGEYPSVSQVDLVPTLSLLLGLPIPFSNLGSVMVDLVNHCSWSKDSHIKEVFHTVEALRLNARQIGDYISMYAKTSSDFPAYRLSQLQDHLMSTEMRLQTLVTEMFTHNFADNAHQKLHAIERDYIQYIHQVRRMCQDIWAKFDIMSMLLGLLMIVATLLMNIYILSVDTIIAEDKGTGTLVIVIVTSLVFVVYVVVQSLFLKGSSVAIMGFILGLFDVVTIGIIIKLVQSNKEESPSVSHTEGSKGSTWCSFKSVTVEKLFAYIAIFVTCISYLSNSFVVYEDSVTVFLCQTFIWIICVKSVQSLAKEARKSRESIKNKIKSQKSTFDITKYISQPIIVVVLITFCCSTMISFSSNFCACREEQVNCTMSAYLQPLSSIGVTVEGSKNVRYFLCLTCMVLVTYLCRQWLKHYGNINGTSPAVICCRYLVPVSTVCTVLHWAVQALPEAHLDSLPVWQQVLLPQIVYVLTVIFLAALVLSPLLIFMLPRKENQLKVENVASDKDRISKVYNYVKESLDEQGNHINSDIPVVYGLATVYSAATVYTGLCVVVLLALLLGDGLAPSLLCAVLALFFFLELISVAVRICKDTDLLFPGCVILSLLTSHFFYATGHHATIPSIRFEAAFVGFHGDWDSKILPAILIHLNTFASEVFFTIISPLVILWPCTKGLLAGYTLLRKADQEGQWKGDYVLFDNPAVLRGLLIKMTAYLYLINGLKVLGAMLSATIHKRHLMVWKIFAPRFVYQAMSSFTVFGVSILSLLVLVRVSSALRKWTDSVNRLK